MKKSAREKLRDITGVESKLSEKEVEVINQLNEIRDIEGLVFAQNMEDVINKMCLNDELLATALFGVNNEGQNFMVHAIYCFFKELDFFYKNRRFDARNESACINASRIIKAWTYNASGIIKVWTYDNAIDSILGKKAEETAKYWANMHRTLQQLLMKVFVHYINQYNSNILTNIELDPMGFI